MNGSAFVKIVKVLIPAALVLVVPLATNATPANKPSSTAAKRPAPATAKRSSSTPEAALHMYRYTDENGAIVTGNTIAPEYARKGYQIVTITGVVVSTVPPEPTAEERAKLATDAQNKISAAQQAEEDKQLLLRYNSVDDIQFAKKRKLGEIDNQIVLLNSNVGTIKSQVDAEHQRAALYERNGQPVPAAQLTKINDLQQALKVTEDQIVSRKEELAAETVRFNKEIERLTFLEKSRPKK